MAQVTLDSSEYDMLRQNLKEAKDQIEQLQELNKGLENKSRVILTTKYPKFNFTKAINAYYQFQRYYNLGYIGEKNCNGISDMCLQSCLQEGFGGITDLTDSTQYIGFDDIKLQVISELKNQYKKEHELAMKLASDSKQKYEDKYNSVEESLQKEFTEKKSKLEAQLEKEKEKFKKTFEEKDKLIKQLKAQNTELQKSQAEKEKEALIALQEAQKKYDDLRGQQGKGFFKKLFK